MGRKVLIRLLSITGLLGMSSAAWASAGTSVPDPTDFGLFALGVTGLILGHYAARRQPPRD